MIGDEIKSALKDIEDNDYQYCIYGGKELPQKMEGSDIDIIVNNVDDNLLSILNKHGFVISKGKQIFLGTVFVACKFTAEYGWIPLHFIVPIYYGFQIAPKKFREYRIERDNLFFATLEFELVIVALLSARSGSITKKRTEKIRRWSEVIDADLLNKILKDTDPGLLPAFKKNISKSFDFNKFLKSIKFFKVKMLWCKVKSKFANKNFKSKRKGIIITLEGIDGSGKTTFVNTVKQFVNKEKRSLFFEASMAGRGYNIWIQKFRTLWRLSCDRKGVLASLFKNSAVFIVLVLEILSCYYLFFVAKYKAKKGYNTVFDRYAYLHYMRQIVHNNADFVTKEFYIKMLHFFLIKTFPQPDVLVYFDTDANLAKERKDEELLDDLILKRQLYDTLLKEVENRTYIYILDSSRPSLALAEQFLIEFWKKLV